MDRLRLFVVFSSVLLVVSPALATLRQSDFDVVALKWDSGETVVDTPFGVFASPAPVLDSAVNLMMRDRTIPFYLTEGPIGSGIVLFGLIDENNWTPADFDGRDLSTQSETIGNRVYASLDGAGNMELLLAKDFSPHIVLDTTTVTIDTDKAFVFLETGLGFVVYYGDDPVLEGFLPETTSGIDPATIGDDFVISVLSGSSETGTATLNDLARNPTLNIAGYPRVLSPHGPDGVDQYFPSGYDVLLQGEVLKIAVPIQNIGSGDAINITAQIVPAPGSGLFVSGPDTANYGTLAPGAGTARMFLLDTNAATIGSHEITIEITGGLTTSLVTSVAVWGRQVNILDLDAGEATFEFGTTFATHAGSLTIPEIIDGPAEPYRFDLQLADHTVTHAEPSFGVHWGDGYSEDPIFLGPRSTKAGDDVNLTIGVRHRSGAAMPGSLIEVYSNGQRVAMGYVNASGSITFNGLPDGALTVYAWPPHRLRDLFKNPMQRSRFYEPGTYSQFFKFPNLPSGYAPRPPGNAQGQNGGQGAGNPTNTCPNCNGKNKTGRSVGWGIGGGLAALALDAAGLVAGAAGGPAAPALAWFLSSLGSAGAGTLAGASMDPIDQDVFYFAQEQTPPNNPDELTLSERVEMTVAHDPIQAWEGPVTITTNYTYTRVTDQDTYTYNGGEVLVHERYLPLTLDTEVPTAGELVVRVDVQLPDLSPLPGPEALVLASLYNGAGDLIQQLVLNDDGQGDDTTATDGAYSGRATGPGVGGTKTVIVVASRSGFFQESVPPWLGFVSNQLFGDGFETGDTSRWSSTVGGP